MPMATVRFVKAQKYNVKAAIGLMIGGIPAVLIAAYLVKSLPLTAIHWLVVIVVLYTAISLIRTALKPGAEVEDAGGGTVKAVA
jgi:uncharacterized membrane protein YfcA